MSTTYNTVAGDTFDRVARIVYGTEQEASRLIAANPGASEPFTAGVVLVVPDIPGAAQQVPADSENEVAVRVDGARFRFWENIRITRAIDAMDTLELVAPFDPDNMQFRKTFVPFSYKSITVNVGGLPLFTGTTVAIVPVIETSRMSVSLSAYSLPGILNDCTAPAGALSLEFDGQNLRDIAIKVAGFFGLGVVFEADPGAVFERLVLSETAKVLTFLANLAKQRNLIISSTSSGEVLFLRSETAGPPVARLRQGQPPLSSVTPFFDAQQYYSHITGIEPVLVGLAGSQFTVKNPRLAGVIRPLTFEVSDATTGDVKAAVEAKAGRMFANAVSYSVTLPTWRDPSGELWRPGSTVTLLAPNAMVYSEYAFLIRSVELVRESASEVATLNFVLPGAFSGQVPEVLPWD